MRIRWEDHVRTEGRARMKSLREEVKSRRWKITGHILRQDRDSDCNVDMTWAPEGKRRKRRPKTTWRRTVEKVKLDGALWMRVVAADREDTVGIRYIIL